MGDRTSCTLYLPLPPKEDLLALFEEHFGGYHNNEDDRTFWFGEVNYGHLPSAVEEHLQEEKTPYVWAWNSGSSFGPGEEIFDGEEVLRLDTDFGGNIVIHLSRIDHKDFIEKAQRFEKFAQSIYRGIL